MRDIKYRAKVCDKSLPNFWTYGSIVHITERYAGEEDFEDCDIWEMITPEGVSFNVDKHTIGQFTDLFDMKRQ